MKEKIKIYKVCKVEGLAPAAPMSARLCALLRQPAANSNKIRVLFSASPAPLCRRGSGTTSPLTGEQNFYFVEFACLLRRASPPLRAGSARPAAMCWSTPCVPAHPPVFGGCLPLSAT